MLGFECSCEMKKHQAPVERYFIEENAIEKLQICIEKYSRVYMVCDETTYKVLGKRVLEILKDEEKLFSYVILPEKSLPDYNTIGNILVHLNDPKYDSDIFEKAPLPDLILAVGSGTINDSCRLVAYRFGIDYGVLATAPSMDGYLSAGSPFLFDSSKATIKCTTPKFLVADIDIIKDAPWDMLLAGIGDMFGKYTGILDWELARDYNGDYYCEKIANDVICATNMCLANGYELEKRDATVIKNIMDGFVVTGLGMAYTGISRPASGAEHIISHVWELDDIEAQREPNLHGIDVCEATRIVALMYLRLLEETDDEHLRGLISKYCGYFYEIEKFCKTVNMPVCVTDRDRIITSILKAHKMRDRYTILFYLDGKGKLYDYAAYATDKFLESIG